MEQDPVTAKKYVISVARRLGVMRAFELFERSRVRILMYHRFTTGTHPHRISAGAFEAQLRYLAARANVISLETAVNALKGGDRSPPFPVVITIDDGYRDAYEVAFPLLSKYKLPATVYAVTGLVDRQCWLWTDVARYLLRTSKKERVEAEIGGKAYQLFPGDGVGSLETAGKINDRLKEMPDNEKDAALRSLADVLDVTMPEAPVEEYAGITPDQAREMDRSGVRVESHTSSHPLMTRIGPERMYREAVRSKARLEEILEREVNHFCYPNGAYHRAAAEAAERAGYHSAVTTDFGSCRTGDDPFALKRLSAEPDMGLFLQNLSGFETFKRRLRSLGM